MTSVHKQTAGLKASTDFGRMYSEPDNLIWPQVAKLGDMLYGVTRPLSLNSKSLDGNFVN